MLNELPIEYRRQLQRQWVSHAAWFFILTLHGLTKAEQHDAHDYALSAFDRNHSGARSVYFGYDLARRRLQQRQQTTTTTMITNHHHHDDNKPPPPR